MPATLIDNIRIIHTTYLPSQEFGFLAFPPHLGKNSLLKIGVCAIGADFSNWADVSDGQNRNEV
jgi:hypothetical protein